MIKHRSDTRISKDFILSKLSQEEIFNRYLGISPDTSSWFKNPLRTDENAGCKFYWQGSQLRFHDFAEGFNEDCFGVVRTVIEQREFKILNFFQICIEISNEFKLLENVSQTNDSPVYNRNANSVNNSIPDNNIRSIIGVKRQEFTKKDLEYWKQYEITMKDLEFFEVASVKIAWLNGEIIYNYSKSDPCFVYKLVEDNKVELKLYFPLRNKSLGLKRFLQTTGIPLQGYRQLPKNEKLCLITSSLKDIIVLQKIGIMAVAGMSETTIISKEKIKELKERFEHVILFLNNDEAGVKQSIKQSEMYDVDYILIPENYPKDPSDFVKEYNLEGLRDLMWSLLNGIL